MPQIAETLIASGHKARSEHRLADALQLFSEALDLSRARASHATEGRALTGLAQIERDQGNNEAALRHYEDAAALYLQLRDPLKWAHTIRHIADIHLHNGSLEEARHGYEQALATYRAHPETHALDLANTLRGFALLSEHAHHPAKAQSAWLEARTLYSAQNVMPGVQECDAHLNSAF